MSNHGILTTGETVSDGFDALYYFEKSAETYLTALATGKELNVVECARDGKDNEYELCQTKGISGFPSWEIYGEIISGTRDLNELAIKTDYQGDLNF